jgi:hypothetical protein
MLWNLHLAHSSRCLGPEKPYEDGFSVPELNGASLCELPSKVANTSSGFTGYPCHCQRTPCGRDKGAEFRVCGLPLKSEGESGSGLALYHSEDSLCPDSHEIHMVTARFRKSAVFKSLSGCQ